MLREAPCCPTLDGPEKATGDLECSCGDRVLRAKTEGKNPAYYVLGETEAGRRLFCVVIRFPDGKPVTARDMTPREAERYAAWKKP